MLNVWHIAIHCHIAVHVTIVWHVRVFLGRVMIQRWRWRRRRHEDWCRRIHSTANNVCWRVSGSLHSVRSRHALLVAPTRHSAVVVRKLPRLMLCLVLSQGGGWGWMWGWWCCLARRIRRGWGFSFQWLVCFSLSLALLPKLCSFVFKPNLEKHNDIWALLKHNFLSC
mgnify:CR=1 FL=1